MGHDLAVPGECHHACPRGQCAGRRSPRSRHGWVVAGGRLLVTADGGSSWRDVTPPGGFGTGGQPAGREPSPISGTAGSRSTRRSRARAILATVASRSGARPTAGQAGPRPSCRRPSSITSARSCPRSSSTSSTPTHGFAFLSGNLAKGANDSDLFYTADGGQTWSADRPTGTGSVGIEGNVAFATANDGVVVNADVGSGIAVTHDGGRTWADAGWPCRPDRPVPSPSSASPCSPTAAPAWSRWTSRATAARHPHVPHDRCRLVLDRCGDVPGRLSWVSVIDQQHWVAISDSAVRHTDDGGATWTQTAAVPPTSHEPGRSSSTTTMAGGRRETAWTPCCTRRRMAGSPGRSSPPERQCEAPRLAAGDVTS